MLYENLRVSEKTLFYVDQPGFRYKHFKTTLSSSLFSPAEMYKGLESLYNTYLC